MTIGVQMTIVLWMTTDMRMPTAMVTYLLMLRHQRQRLLCGIHNRLLLRLLLLIIGRLIRSILLPLLPLIIATSIHNILQPLLLLLIIAISIRRQPLLIIDNLCHRE